ncbi:hypothetical protein TNCV_2207531 [Trichonephila clavipes]|uniref:Mutator-like transposase domain-containing protein n=1 Tax=Trichonephila clavipes TaxID=2585209 RepID=A0A8X6S9J8_TRICX|nr:hypothetical protein TNCV_2207531 [Trichonephila clavipes]
MNSYETPVSSVEVLTFCILSVATVIHDMTENFEKVLNLQTIITFVDGIIGSNQTECLCKWKSTGQARLSEESVARVTLYCVAQRNQFGTQVVNASDDCLESVTQMLRTTSLSFAVATSSKTDRLRFTRQIASDILMHSNEDFIDYVVFIDESTFHLSRHGNTHNALIWSFENSHKELELKRDSLTLCPVSYPAWIAFGFSVIRTIANPNGVLSQWIRINDVLLICSKKAKVPDAASNAHVCCNHMGSASSMETVGAYRIFERSENHRKLQYTDYYGDGDSKVYD